MHLEVALGTEAVSLHTEFVCFQYQTYFMDLFTTQNKKAHDRTTTRKTISLIHF